MSHVGGRQMSKMSPNSRVMSLNDLGDLKTVTPHVIFSFPYDISIISSSLERSQNVGGQVGGRRPPTS